MAPGGDGELAILPHHAPLLTTLKPGEIRVINDGEETYIAVSGGFLEMIGNKATVLADTGMFSLEAYSAAIATTQRPAIADINVKALAAGAALID